MLKTRTHEYDYELPRELIAQQPLPCRDQSRMMVVTRENGGIHHRRFTEFPDFLHAGDLLVLNNTRVIPARVWGRKENRKIEFLFLQEISTRTWEVLCRPARKVRTGDRIVFSPRLAASVREEKSEGKRVLHFSSDGIREELGKIGFAPLPPYIKRESGMEKWRPFDLDRYQTVFAEHDGSIAAPTAGLHFTGRMLERVQAKNIQLEHITLSVGAATFQPVRTDDIRKHRMTEEHFHISPETAGRINSARKEGRRVVAVGTTSVRALESAVKEGRVQSGKKSTGLFIYPGYRFQVVDALLTNFHLPRSTLLMLTSAFGGYELIRRAYQEAVKERYRFFSYGDCMLIV
ncbi:MAG: tRNA preQ1(34) S-adenosylmethionine ribosyltransferase-isomerase QueA [Candidatus Aminicenantes bacterium]